MKIAAVIAAGGSGTRYSIAKNKLFEQLGGIPVIFRTIRAVSSLKEIDEIIVVTSEQNIQQIQEYNFPRVKKVVPGGKTRQESVFNGLKALNTPDYVLIHDGARPLVSAETLRLSITTAVQKGGAIAAVPTKDTIKRVESDTGEVLETLDRSRLWNVQTPQVFRFGEIIKAHEDFRGEDFTDDAALMEKAGYRVFVVPSSYRNIKITTEEDLGIAKILI